MRIFLHNSRLSYYIFLTIIFCLISTVEASEKTTYLGWEKDSVYDGYYNFKERDSLKGKVLQFKEVTPLPGMDPGTAFILKEGDDKIVVHLCPAAFISLNETGIRKGIKTKVSGSWALIDGQDVFIAAKVKQGDSFVLKVRLTQDGTPFWSLSPEELAKESASN
jgi:hypothetical protein